MSSIMDGLSGSQRLLTSHILLLILQVLREICHSLRKPDGSKRESIFFGKLETPRAATDDNE